MSTWKAKRLLSNSVFDDLTFGPREMRSGMSCFHFEKVDALWYDFIVVPEERFPIHDYESVHFDCRLASLVEGSDLCPTVHVIEVDMSRDWMIYGVPGFQNLPSLLRDWLIRSLNFILIKHVSLLVLVDGYDRQWIMFRRSHFAFVSPGGYITTNLCHHSWT